MEVKIFDSSTAEFHTGKLEKEINAWLQEAKEKIVFICQSTYTAGTTPRITITVWYT